LEVYTIPGDNTVVFQRYASMTHGRTFTRKRIDGVWSEWTETAVKSDIAAETERASAAESNLSDAVIAEKQRAETAKNTVAQSIADETERAQTAESLKVDKIEGKGLSTRDYTAEEKQKLAGLENYIPPDMTLVYRGEYDANIVYMKGDAVMGKYDDVGVSAYSTWVSLTDNNVGNKPPSNESNSYWRIIGSYGPSGFIGRCRYPEISITGETEVTLNKKRGLILTNADPYNSVGIWGTLAVLRPTANSISSSDSNNDYIVYEKGGELYDARGKLSAVIKYGEEETDTGKEWIDGKPIYRRAFTGNASTANNISITLTTGVGFIVACGGGWQPGYSSGDYVCLTAPGNNQISCTGGLYLKGNGTVVFYSSSATSRENVYNAYGIWVEYTKK
jgi:hypothetical protein